MSQSLKISILLLIGICLSGNNFVLSQKLDKAVKEQKQKVKYVQDVYYALKVKQVDEFIERFNNNFKYSSKSKGVKRKKEYSRIDVINSLFNRNKKWDKKLKDKFISYIKENQKSTNLSFYDQSWFAKVKSTVTYLGNDYPVELTLKVQINPNLSSKWVIIGAEVPFLKLPEPVNKNAHINPTNHNVKFSKLPRVMKDSLNLKSYVNADFKEDKLTLLFYEIMKNSIRMKSIDEITYHFLQLKNWTFIVRKFNRDTSNSGWLIDELYEMSWENKGTYLVNRLNLN